MHGGRSLLIASKMDPRSIIVHLYMSLCFDCLLLTCSAHPSNHLLDKQGSQTNQGLVLAIMDVLQVCHIVSPTATRTAIANDLTCCCTIQRLLDLRHPPTGSCVGCSGCAVMHACCELVSIASIVVTALASPVSFETGALHTLQLGLVMLCLCG